MNDDVLQDLQRLQQYASGLQGLIQDAASRLPERFEGMDPTGAVRVEIDGDGFPVTFDVDYDWKRNLRPAAFGRAVEQAVQAAVNRRLAAWGEAFGGVDWEQSVRVPDPTAPTSPRLEQADRRPRDVGDLLRDLLDATSDLDALTAGASAEGVGTAGYGRVEVRLSADGSLSCTADQFWVSDRTGQELNEALIAAVAAAREEIARARAAGPAGRVAGILDEALTILRDSSR